jgi:hypothetical protein
MMMPNYILKELRMSNVIPMPKREKKEHHEDRLIIVQKTGGWVDYVFGDVFFVDDDPFGYGSTYRLLSLDPVRARQIDEPEVIRDLVRNKLKMLKAELEAALEAIEKPIITFDSVEKEKDNA